jgi:hypothetical protein
MAYQPVIFAAQSGLHDSERQVSSQRLVNVFPERTISEDEPVLLRSCPGRTLIEAGTGQPVRQMLGTSDAIYFVRNAKLYSFDGSTSTFLGDVADDINTTMAFNGTEVGVVANSDYFLWDGSSVSLIPGTAFTEFGSIDFMDGFFLLTELDGQRHQISGLFDGSTLDALDFASAEYRPDDLVIGFVDHSEWWLFGETTIEVWSNEGLADYPFVRVAGAQMERGCLQPNTVAKLDNTVLWTGDDKIAYRADQYTPARISNHHVEAAIRAATSLSAFVYEYEGHKFYVLRFPDRPAWVYDAATNVWHERASGVGFGPWDVTAAAKLNGEWYAGDKDGNISKIDRVFQENGEVMLRTAQSANLWLAGNRFNVNSVNVDVKVGTGGTVMFSYSNDQGLTWGLEQFMSVGEIGDFSRHFSFYNLGRTRDFAARLRMSDNVDFSINHAGADIST